jgi:MoaA/NifB/PqqE/SkfB family radical SAM enzyme
MIDRKTNCDDIHHTLSLKFYNGAIKVGPCCLAQHVTVTPDVKNLWEHQFLLELRKENLLHIIPDACLSCSRLEQKGIDSRRSNHLKFYTDKELLRPGIRMLDIHLPNLCNLKCVICGSHNSSSWHADTVKLGKTIPVEFKYNKTVKYNVIDLEIPDTIETIKFWGGEPLLEELHADILEAVNKKGLLKNVRVIYNTNATCCVSDRVLELWSKAKLVELYFSLDDIDERSDFQRTGSTWAQLVDNLKWFYKNMPHNHLFYVMCSVGALNIYNLPALVDWKRDNFDQTCQGDYIQLLFNMVNGEGSVDRVSPEFYKKLQDRFMMYPELQHLLKILTIEDGYVPEQFLNYMKQLDSIRGTNFLETFPEYV